MICQRLVTAQHLLHAEIVFNRFDVHCVLTEERFNAIKQNGSALESRCAGFTIKSILRNVFDRFLADPVP